MAYTPGCAPSILITFINMILRGHSQVREGCSEYMFPGQTTLQLACVIIAALCVPVMLFGKPLFFLLHKKSAQTGKVLVNNSLNLLFLAFRFRIRNVKLLTINVCINAYVKKRRKKHVNLFRK